MTSSALDASIRSLPALTQALNDPATSLVILRPDGHWHLERSGTLTFQDTPLPPATVNAILSHLHTAGPTACLKRWWLEPLQGAALPLAIFKPRADLTRNPLSKHTLELLRPRLSTPINGLIFCPHQAPRQSLLLWLATQLPHELTLYISAVPPIAPSSVPLIHLFPPEDHRSRCRLADIATRATTLLWDAPLTPEDLPLLFSPLAPRQRWLAADIDLLPDHLLQAILPHISIQLGLHTDRQIATLSYLTLRTPRGWKTLLDTENRDSSSPFLSRATEDPTIPLPHVNQPSPHRQRNAPTIPLQSGEIALDTILPEPLDRRQTLQNYRPPPPDLHGERVDRALANLHAEADIDAIEIPRIELDQLRQTVEVDSDEALKSLRDLRAQSLLKTRPPSDDTPNETTNELRVPNAIARLHRDRSDDNDQT
ncbi:hypothetical protein DL240_07270 [Lujinxingia litoralis]|uniref:Uncharacterized protein n=1 Tax=Lujinxingia litoralis TaxID=2211119 RepID=A0A328C8X3_9DELT|nr:hypothetical protein [Lujinxingia litoralis]RAL23940.1 hypothetical protein DL240_07270 [Lujinxingia litoralis]